MIVGDVLHVLFVRGVALPDRDHWTARILARSSRMWMRWIMSAQGCARSNDDDASWDPSMRCWRHEHMSCGSEAQPRWILLRSGMTSCSFGSTRTRAPCRP